MAYGQVIETLSVVNVDTLINNGWIILHGRLLERPFHLRLANDTLWINDEQFRPQPSDPLLTPPTWIPEYTELGEWYFSTSELFVDSCQMKYKQWRRALDAKAAMDSLLEYIAGQKLIKIFRATPISDDAVKIVFDYRQLDLMKNPTPILMELFSQPEYENMEISILLWGESDEANQESSQTDVMFDEFCRIKTLLNFDMFLVLNYSGWCEWGRVKGREQEYIDAIKDILTRFLSDEEAIHQLILSLQIDSLDAQYIIHKRYYWLQETWEKPD